MRLFLAILIFVASYTIAASMSVNQVIQKQHEGGEKPAKKPTTTPPDVVIATTPDGIIDTTPDDSYLTDTTTPKKPTCGVTSPLAPKIVGGKNVTSLLTFPWLARLDLEYDTDSEASDFCGATLISENWVVSAAHCLHDTDTDIIAVNVVLSDLYREKDEVGEVVIPIAETIEHEGYNGTTYENDIVLYKLERAANYSDTVFPACLPCNSYNYTGTDFTFAGWGDTSSGGKASAQLMEVSLPYVPNDVCAEQYEDVYNSQICAGGINTGKDTCQGDSGGPGISKNGGVSYLVGIVSNGDGCGTNYGINTRVSSFIDWIEYNTGETFC